MEAKGRAFAYGDNVDTDVIIPARYLNTIDPAELASHCMEDIDATFAPSVRAGDIIVAGSNFGCGSSREHAPIAIKASGVSCVIASSFARIFYRNAINIGLPILELPEAGSLAKKGDEIRADFETGKVENLTTGACAQAVGFPPFMREIMKAGGLIGYVRARIARDASVATGGGEVKYRIATIPGDGIGPDVVKVGVTVLEAVAARFGFDLSFAPAPMGGRAIDEFGEPLPASSLEACRKSDAVLLGAVGGPKWDKLPGHQRPEAGLLAIRAGLGVFANLRPAIMFPQLAGACPLKASIVEGGLDILVVRELTGGIYFGDRGRSPDGLSAWDTERYSKPEIERLLKVGFEAAARRKNRLCVVDKANVLESSRLWRETAMAMGPSWPGIELSFMYVDNAAMQLVKAPRQFDVIATSNMFGDILSDEASMITGSIGMLASASLGISGPGLYEPIHGSAPDIAGQDKANPLATVLSTALLLRHSLGLEEAALAVEAAVSAVLDQGYRCADIASRTAGDAAGERLVGTVAMGEAVVRALREAGK